MAEASATLRAGSAVVSNMKKLRAADDWPNLHESLLELYAILFEWCGASHQTTRVIAEELARRGIIANAPGLDEYLPKPPSVNYFDGPLRSNVAILYIERPKVFGIFPRRGFVDTAIRDMRRLISPRKRLYQQWRASKRRAAKRRGLKSFMSVYFPDLLTDFIDAVEERQKFVNLVEREAKLKARLIRSIRDIDDGELQRLGLESARTSKGLLEVEFKLKYAISGSFPLS